MLFRADGSTYGRWGQDNPYFHTRRAVPGTADLGGAAEIARDRGSVPRQARHATVLWLRQLFE